MDTINVLRYIFSESNESIIGRYGNNAVNLINKFIRLIIAFGIVYLVIIKLPDHGDKDHTMYFNLILLISIFLLFILIRQYLRQFYIKNILGALDLGKQCAQDINPVNTTDEHGVRCDTDKNIFDALTEILLPPLKEKLKSWSTYFWLIVAGIALKTIDLPIWYALLIWAPLYVILGTIYWFTYVSKYSPINFIFGKTWNGR